MEVKLPSAKQISSASERILVLEDWHSFGQYYDQTLMAWHQNFTKNWDKVILNLGVYAIKLKRGGV
jgi:cyclopropane-fatty-acyl-phospholipid synthase